MKPGYKTTEFWLALLGTALGCIYHAGLGTAAGPALTVGSALGAVLPCVGYSISRGMAKAGEATVQN